MLSMLITFLAAKLRSSEKNEPQKEESSFAVN